MEHEEKEQNEELLPETFEEDTSEEAPRSDPRALRRHHARRLAEKRQPSNPQAAKKRKSSAPFRAESSDAPARVLARSVKTPGGRYSQTNQRNPRRTLDQLSLQERSAQQKGIQEEN